MLGFLCGSVLFAVMNSISYKTMLNKYKSRAPLRSSESFAPPAAVPDSTDTGTDGNDESERLRQRRRLETVSSEHNYEFFANQFNVFVYVLMTWAAVLYRRLEAGPTFFSKQYINVWGFATMGLLDAMSGFLCSFGGAYVDGSLQNLLNQCIIPLTLVMSVIYLKVSYTCPQYTGSAAILGGTGVAVVPGIGASSHTNTTPAGMIIYFFSIVPTSVSNVYKETAFREKKHCDVYVLSAIVAMFQVLWGFLFLPLLALPGFGGIPFSEMPAQMSNGFSCFLGYNSLPGDHCNDKHNVLHTAFAAMMIYCVINFGYNVFQLLVTKHGSAMLMVMSSALSLPVTNMAFACPWLMGENTEDFTVYDVAALCIVVIGFVIYSRDALTEDADTTKRETVLTMTPRGSRKTPKRRGRLLPVQAAGGSVVYTRERANSDPTTPGHTPVFRKIGSPRSSLMGERVSPYSYQSVSQSVSIEISSMGQQEAGDRKSVV